MPDTEKQFLLREIERLRASLEEVLNANLLLREEIQRLKDDISILKGQKPRPKIPPSILEGPHSKGKGKGTTGSSVSRGKHVRRKKTRHLEIHSKQRIRPEGIPEGAVFKGCLRYTVQDIVIQSHNTRYELERWRLPDGSYMTGEIPANVEGHYGPCLVTYVLHQYYSCRVTEPLLLNQLREMGILVSGGQLSNILTKGKDSFHAEKGSLLLTGISTGQINVDDTGARHGGKNGYSTVVCNQYFTFAETTDSKSRINFLRILHGKTPQYLVNEVAADYIESISPSGWLKDYLLLHGNGIGRAMTQAEWDSFLLGINLREAEERLATEAALVASLVEKGVPLDLGVHSDDAGQFDVFVRSLCWIHEERHYRKIIPSDEEARKAIQKVRDELWSLYNGLKEYKAFPSDARKAELSEKFDCLFLQTTSSPTLNKRLAQTYAKKERLLRVLERPGTPLHNNGAETDVREFVTKRKVSGGTRSDDGKRCRDTFLSLKKTCIKLRITFWNYLHDRVSKTFRLPPLSHLMEAARVVAQPQ